jgi:putative autotransporter adhesin-like protein
MKKVLILLSIVILLFACDVDTNKLERIPVSGDVVMSQDYFENFTEIIIVGPFDVVIDQNGGSGIQVESYESLMPWVTTEILDDGTFLLYLEDTSKARKFDITFDEDDSVLDQISRHAIFSSSRLKWPDNDKVLNVVLSVDDLDKIQILGESSIKTAQTFKTKHLNFEVAGAVNLDGDFDVETFNADIAGAGNLKMNGSVNSLELNCAGAGTIRAYGFKAKHVQLEIAGVCNAHLYAEESLDVEIAGMGTVKYMGDPENVSIDKAGFGSVKQVVSEEIEEIDEI